MKITLRPIPDHGNLSGIGPPPFSPLELFEAGSTMYGKSNMIAEMRQLWDPVSGRSRAITLDISTPEAYRRWHV